MNIPLVDLAAQQAEMDAEVGAGLDEVFATTAFIGGKAVSEFERPTLTLTDVAHCVGVANGTDALELALRGRRCHVRRRGDPSGQYLHRHRRGGVAYRRRPVLVDCDPSYLLIDPEKVRGRHHVPHPGDHAGPPLRSGRSGREDPRIEIARLRAFRSSRTQRSPKALRATARFAGALGMVPAPASTRARTSVQPVTQAP